MSELGDKQKLFCRLLPKLLKKAHKLGYECSLGDAYRDPRLHGMIGVKKGYGHRNSNHKRRLAIDINLFKDGRYLDASEDYRELAEYWKGLHPECRAGIDFGDGNHFSISYRGQS
jgi:hypothetical protein